MPTARKKQTVKELNQLFNESQVLVFTDYRGLKVSDLNNLRRQLRDKGVEYHIAKNTLTELAAKRAGTNNLGNLLDGPTAIAFVNQDIPGAAKVLQDFVRTSRILTIRGALAGSQILNPDQVSDLTKILTREEYIAKMMGSLNSPVSSLVSVLANTVRSVVNVLQAYADKLSEQGGAASEGAEAPAEAPAAPAEMPAETPAQASVEAPAEAPAEAEMPAEAPAETATPETPEAPLADGAEPEQS